jgi:phage head maturation protease
MTVIGPLGWHPSSLEQRFVTSAPSSFDEATRSVSAIISTGAAVQRFYGIKILEISRDAIDIRRVSSGQCVLLDSHRSDGITHALGRVTETWIKSGALWGRLALNATSQGDLALGMFSRSEIAGISVGYRVAQWEVRDEDGWVIDQELAYSHAASFTYIAKRWELLETSLVSVGADAGAGIRGDIADDDDLDNVRARMQARQNMSDKMSRLADNRWL